MARTAYESGDTLLRMLMTHDAAVFARGVERRAVDLRDSDPAVRWRAALVLGAIGERADSGAVAALVGALNDPDDGVRGAAARSLAAIGSSAAAALTSAFEHPDPAVRWAAVAALEDMGDAGAVDALVSALAHDDPQACECAMSALAGIGARAVAPLCSELAHRDPAVRACAASALGEIGDPRALMPLVAALTDDEAGVRGSAARALGELGDGRAFAPLMLGLCDDDAAARRGACSGLGRLGDERATWPLVSALDDADPDVRCAAARSLGEVGGARAVDALVDVLRNDACDAVRHECVDALGEIGEPAVDRLIEALDRGDEELRAWAAAALEIIDAPEVQTLVERLDEFEDGCSGAPAPAPDSATADFQKAMHEAYAEWSDTHASGSSADRFLEADRRARLLARFVTAAREWAAAHADGPLTTARAVDVLLDAFDEAVGHPKFDRLIDELEAVYTTG